MLQKIFYKQLVLVPAVSKRFKKHRNSSSCPSVGEMIFIIKVSSGIIKACPESTENPYILIKTFRTGINFILP